ncbi:phosphate ABC transporter substrate-binding protein [Paenibacillus agricola]|uniref:Phosphate ABC transporter substrate-binding protein n=1 Tax=Paenibacillus agricola TaxID=2716264 RepID=A0ABX0IZC2_9BACL|nr:phosphate ABC transporter substrate-binding protein [Paenibacillus agricola]NHN29063.1 phosphate ABC transporter substrate-binding protein [Paenibacillus agricola]
MTTRKWTTYAVLATFFLVAYLVVVKPSPASNSYAAVPDSNVIHIRGSDTVLPIVQLIAESYMADNPQEKVVVNGGGTSHGTKSLIDDTTDISMASAGMTEDLDRMVKDKKLKFTNYLIGRDALVVFVHPENPVTGLTLEQIKQIYKGDINNWSEVGGANLEIEVTSQDPSQGTYETWREKVMGSTSFLTKKTRILESRAIQSYTAAHKGAIGYISTLSVNKTVKPLPINGISADAHTIKAETYPISRNLSIYVREEQLAHNKLFIDYILEPAKGQKIAQNYGIIPAK